MEPEDIPVHDLLGVGDEAAPGPDPLRAIVARAGRRRLRMAAGGMALALAGGGVVGYTVSNHSSSPTRTATAPAASHSGSQSGTPSVAPSVGSASSNAASGAPSSGAVGGPSIAQLGGGLRLTHLFTRPAGPVTIRGFLSSFSLPQGALPNCQISGPAFQAEVSTADMVGVVSSGFGLTRAGTSITLVDAQIVGSAEGDPIEVVTVGTAAGVASVRMSFAGGKFDQMAPVKGWAALVGPASSTAAKYGSPVGDVIAYNASGHQVAKMAITNGFNLGAVGGGTARLGAGQVMPSLACVSPPCPTVPRFGLPSGTQNGAPLPATSASTAVSPGVPTVSSGSAAASGTATVAPSPPVYACPEKPMTPPATSGGSAGNSSGSVGSSGSGSSTGSASSGAGTSSAG